MTNNEMEKKLAELMSNPDAVAQMEAVDTAEAMKKVFKDFGLEASEAEMDALVLALNESSEDHELNEDELDEMSGGAVVGALCKALSFTWGVACDYYGGPSKAIQMTVVNWQRILSGNANKVGRT